MGGDNALSTHYPEGEDAAISASSKINFLPQIHANTRKFFKKKKTNFPQMNADEH